MKATQIFFGGTAYLGIPFNEKFKGLVFKGIEMYGTNYGSSRNNNLKLDIYSIAESESAKRYHCEDSIIVSSGYLAAQLVIQHYLTNYKFIYAPDTHPALWIGNPNPPQTDFRSWTERVIVQINNSDEPCLIITNSLNNLIPEIYQFDWIKEINPNKKSILLVDDSHGIGITGKSGEGVISRIPKDANVEIIVIASMAKSLGVDAGLILGKKELINELRNTPVYAGSSPPSPGNLYAYVHASEIYAEQIEKLDHNIQFFTSLIKENDDIVYEDGFPVFLLKNNKTADLLKNKDIIISSFPYPDPQGQPINRIVVTSEHSHGELRELALTIIGAE